MRIVDLFSGAGGLTFGFYYKLENGQFIKTNNEFVFANEFDKHAANAFSSNYNDIKMFNCDIKDLAEEEVIKVIGEKSVDIIIGGPPCQSFSTVGKRQFDEKAKLYLEYLRMLKIIKPKMFLFENVKGMLSMREEVPVLNEFGNEKYDTAGEKITTRGDLLIDIIEKQFDNIDGVVGYRIVGKQVLNAKNFGVPQSRERVFLIGVRNDLVDDIKWEYPTQTHGTNLLDYITIEEAISDLPHIEAGDNYVGQYTTQAKTSYQKLMRGKNDEITQHYCGKHNSKLSQIIAKVPQGEGRQYINKMVEQGELPEECYLTSGYNNTYGRFIADLPSTTITNNMCTPSALRCIHYEQNRTITPREGARIQSFPDWYKFSGTRSNVTKQIGNAVPPLVALEIARQIEKALMEI